MSKQIIILAAIIAIAVSFTFTPKIFQNSKALNKVPETVPYVDIAKYLGTWYEQSVIPFYF
jgi:lipocalin